MNEKRICPVQAYQSITVRNVHDSFKETGLWPMRFNFADRFRTARDARRQYANGIKNDTEVAGVSLKSANRQNVARIAAEIVDITEREIGPPPKLQAVKILLKQKETVNDVVMSIGPGGCSRRSSVGGEN